MNRAEKVEAVELLESELKRATVTLIAEYRGLTVTELNRLRRAVRDADGRCRVAKNTLAKRAAVTANHEKLSPALRGPLALIMGFKDPVAVAKLAVKFAEEMPKLEIKGAVLDGRLLPAGEVKALATLPAREVILAQLLGLLQAPATHLVRLINEPGSRVARLVGALRDRAEAASGGESA